MHQNIVGSLSTRVFETRTATGREHSVCQDSGVSHIFILIIHNREKVLSIVNVMCEDELQGKTTHFRLPSASQNRACLSSLVSRGDGLGTRKNRGKIPYIRLANLPYYKCWLQYFCFLYNQQPSRKVVLDLLNLHLLRMNSARLRAISKTKNTIHKLSPPPNNFFYKSTVNFFMKNKV